MERQERMHIILADDDLEDREPFKEAIEELNLDVDLSIFKSGDELLDFCITQII